MVDRVSPLDRARVQRVLDVMLPQVPEASFRLVGTASCVLRGIEMPASDIDVLFRDRVAVDAWVAALSGAVTVHDPPVWLSDAQQYFARLSVEGVTIELSTVEIDADTDTAESVGLGPWIHFDVVPCGVYRVPTVALELRLVSEIARQRPDRFGPLVAYLRTHPCDLALVQRGLAANSTPPDDIARLIEYLSMT
jgi:hypothetical protein